MPHHFIVLGAPRSGTSMVASLFASAGLHVGNDLLSPTISNPSGYFESKDINALNNRLVDRIVRWPGRLEHVRRRVDLHVNLDRRAYPFASPWLLRDVRCDDAMRAELASHVARDSFCYKDPRFCVTLGAWRQVLPADTQFIVVFREPTKTIQSYLKNGLDVYRPPLVVPMHELSLAYSRNYERLLRWSSERWRFLHYDQIFTGEGLENFSRWADVQLSPRSIDPQLRRSTGGTAAAASKAAWRTYRSLCARAGFRP